MYVGFDQNLEKAIKKACNSQVKLNDFMILCELYKLGEITQSTFKKRANDMGIKI